ncbi:GNAT family N-acetyltransferase [Paenibacillus illinoisensis]|uniref:GNAT family N-acetyltransferase n=1 Tax=Paenibacillus illinoisensis TaxID=59845 RepID=UPI0016192774|nr:GNAT family N-acetyltransferase [Paenibacillus illinoisensis]MBY0217755.1 GNAT family N-acetyltransferase [Paenibacillus illinoisensis]
MSVEITLKAVDIGNKDVLYNLYQYYQYDFSPFTKEDLGLKGHFEIDLEHYWEDPRWNPFLIWSEKRIIGFLIILFENYDTDPDPTHVIYDFLIISKYRRRGLGKLAAVQAFNLYRANWKVVQMKTNEPAIHFWRDVINQYTAGQYNEVFREDLNKYVHTFTNRNFDSY